jgi:hypothetical protein
MTGSRDEASVALSSLPVLERVLTGRLIRRQLRMDPRALKTLDTYGPEGTVHLYSATALRLFMLCLWPPGVFFAVSGENAVEWAISAVFLLLALGGYVRAFTAARLGRRWRASRATGADVGAHE